MKRLSTAILALALSHGVVVGQNATALPDDKEKAEHSSLHAQFNWAKVRLDEMDAALAAWEGKTAELQGDARLKAENSLAEMRAKRDAFGDTAKKAAEMTEAEWNRAKAAREKDWHAFEAGAQKYLEQTGAQAEQLKAAFQARADAQRRVWQEAIKKLQDDAAKTTADQKTKADAAVKQMKADRDAAEAKLEKLKGAGKESWSAFEEGLAEARAAFDRANQTAHEAFAKSK